MSIRDTQNDFGFVESTLSSPPVQTNSIAGVTQTFLARNTWDTGQLGAYLTELAPNDQILTIGAQFIFVDQGGCDSLKFCINWTTAVVPAAGLLNPTLDVQLITSVGPTLTHDAYGNPIDFSVMVDFGPQPASNFVAGYRQLASLPRSANWLRYIGVQIVPAPYNNGSPIFTQGAFVSWIGLGFEGNVLGYVEGFSIK